MFATAVPPSIHILITTAVVLPTLLLCIWATIPLTHIVPTSFLLLLSWDLYVQHRTKSPLFGNIDRAVLLLVPIGFSIFTKDATYRFVEGLWMWFDSVGGHMALLLIVCGCACTFVMRGMMGGMTAKFRWVPNKAGGAPSLRQPDKARSASM